MQYGGSPVQERVARAWLDRGVRLLQGYGMTEAVAGGLHGHPRRHGRAPDRGGGAALLHRRRAAARRPPGAGRRRAGRAGRPRARTCSPATGTGPRRRRRLRRRGSGSAPATCCGSSDDGWAHVVDRVKDMYISGGENVYPAEVEAVAVQLDAVANCAVVGVADRRWGEVGVAYVQLREGATLTEAELRAHLRGQPGPLQGAQVPRVRARAAAQRHRQDPPGRAAPPRGRRASRSPTSPAATSPRPEGAS